VPAGTKLTIGVRPEHLVPVGANGGLHGVVEMVEPLGADTLVHLGMAGRTVIARLPQGASPAIGERMNFDVLPSRVYVFDASSGERIVQ
jgi:multiple sugar transport system ATP-binding protein